MEQVVRSEDSRWVKKYWISIPIAGRGKKGRLTNRWHEKARKVYEGVTWKRVANDRLKSIREGMVYTQV